MYYYCDENGTVCGPDTFEQIGEWVSSGELSRETLLQHAEEEVDEGWISYEKIEGATAAAGYYHENGSDVHTSVTSFESESLGDSEAASPWGWNLFMS